MSIIALIRRHDALRGLPRWLVMMIAAATASLGLITYAAARRQELAPEILIALAWFFVTLFFLTDRDRRRCAAFDLTLPIPARRIWLAHVTAVTIAGMVSLAIIVGIISGALRLLDRIDAGLVDSVLGVSGLLQLPAGLLLLVAWRESSWRDRAGDEVGKRYWPGSLFQVLVVLALVLLLSQRPPASALLLLAPALILLTRTWRGLPAVITLEAPGATAGMRQPLARPASFDTEGGVHGGLLLAVTVLTGTAKHFAALLFGYLFLLFFGAVLGGLFPDLLPIRLTFLPITVYMIFAMVGKPLQLLAPFDALPVSRQRLLAILMLPCVLLLSVGYVIGETTHRLGGFRQERLRVLQAEEADMLVVPTFVCEIARDGAPPPAVAPWGESHQVWSAPLAKGLDARIYSPFSAPSGCSPEFFAWQLARAVEAVYGVALPDEELQRRYLRVDGAGALRVRSEMVLGENRIAIREHYPDLRSKRSAPWFLILLGLATLLSLVLLPPYFSGFRAAHSDTRRNVAFGVILVLVMVVHLGVYALLMAGVIQDYLLSGGVELLARHLDSTIPGARIYFGLILVLVAAAAWRWAARSFERAELTPKRRGSFLDP